MATFYVDVPVFISVADGVQPDLPPVGGSPARGQPGLVRLKVTATTAQNAQNAAATAIIGAGISGS